MSVALGCSLPAAVIFCQSQIVVDHTMDLHDGHAKDYLPCMLLLACFH